MRSTAERGRLEIEPGCWLDARRAVFLEEPSVLALADLHLGYAWAQRAAGNLIPLEIEEGWERNLVSLMDDYAPREVVVLGDLVHASVAVPPFEAELVHFVDLVQARALLSLVVGNHDRQLARVLDWCGRKVVMVDALARKEHLLVHGHETVAHEGKILMGHEHPVLTLDDPMGGGLRCPCFLVGERVTVLPAMSRWAGGSNIRSGRFLSPIAREEKFVRAIAILGQRLLPVVLGG